MKPLIIAPTSKTPEAWLDHSEGVIEIKGRSVPENTYEYYSLLMRWIEEYKNNPCENTTININLEFFNSGSARCIMDLLRSLETLMDSGKNISINWFFDADDEDMRGEIEIFESLVKIPFHISEINNN